MERRLEGRLGRQERGRQGDPALEPPEEAWPSTPGFQTNKWVSVLTAPGVVGLCHGGPRRPIQHRPWDTSACAQGCPS